MLSLVAASLVLDLDRSSGEHAALAVPASATDRDLDWVIAHVWHLRVSRGHHAELDQAQHLLHRPHCPFDNNAP